MLEKIKEIAVKIGIINFNKEEISTKLEETKKQLQEETKKLNETIYEELQKTIGRTKNLKLKLKANADAHNAAVKAENELKIIETKINEIYWLNKQAEKKGLKTIEIDYNYIQNLKLAIGSTKTSTWQYASGYTKQKNPELYTRQCMSLLTKKITEFKEYIKKL